MTSTTQVRLPFSESPFTQSESGMSLRLMKDGFTLNEVLNIIYSLRDVDADLLDDMDELQAARDRVRERILDGEIQR